MNKVLDYTPHFNEFCRGQDFPLEFDTLPSHNTTLKNGVITPYLTDNSAKGKLFIAVKWDKYKGVRYPKVTVNSFQHGGGNATYSGLPLLKQSLSDVDFNPASITVAAPQPRVKRASEDNHDASKQAVVDAITAHLHKPQSTTRPPYASKYLQNKGLGEFAQLHTTRGLRLYNSGMYKQGIVIPFQRGGKITGYQLILDAYIRYDKRGAVLEGDETDIYTKTDKDKQFRGVVKGSYASIGKPYDPQQGTLYLTEGYATGLSVYAADRQRTVVYAGSCHFLADAIGTIKSDFPNLKRVVICADNNHLRLAELGINAGVSYAIEAKLKHQSRSLQIDVCTVPNSLIDVNTTDFNDLHHIKGILLTDKLVSEYTLSDDHIAEKANYLAGDKLTAAPTRPDSQSNKALVTALFTPAVGFKGVVKELESRYLPESMQDEILNTKGSIFIHSAMDTGKTYLIKGVFKKTFEQGGRVLYIAPSIALTNQLAAHCEDMGVPAIHYSTVSNTAPAPNDKPYIAISTINSIHKFGGVEFDTIIMDESEQVLTSIAQENGTIDEPQATIHWLDVFMKQARRMVCCDAQMTNVTVEFMQIAQSRAMQHTDSVMYFNTHKAATGKEIEFLSTEGEAWALVQSEADNHIKMLILANTCARSEQVYLMLSTEYPHLKGGLLNGKQDDDTVKNTLKNINGAVKKLDYLVASPVLSSGVSIDVSHFDHVIGLYEPHSEGLPSIVGNIQQLGRARRVTKFSLYFKNRTAPDLPCDKGEIFKLQQAHLAQYVTEYKVTGNTMTTEFTPYLGLHLAMVSKGNLLDRFQEDALLTLAEMEGFTIKRKMPDMGRKLTGNALKKVYKELVDRGNIEKVARADIVGFEQAEKLRRAACRAEEKLAIIRHDICEFTGVKPMDLQPCDVAAWDKGRLRGKIEKQELLNTPDSELAVTDGKNFEQAKLTGHDITTFTSLKADKWFYSTVRTAYFAADGTPLSVCSDSESIRAACENLLKNEKELKRRGVNVKKLVDNPLITLNAVMRAIGYKTTQIDSKRTKEYRFYTCEIDEKVREYLDTRQGKKLREKEELKACKF